MDAALINPTTLSSLQGLSFLWLEITAKCNLECVHCYSDSSPRQEMFGHMQTADWLTILRDSAELGCKQVQFIGGEPTLHPDLARMISFASKSGYTFIEVFTNATILNESLLNVFTEQNVHIATSFYSDDPQTHDLITKHEGSFSRTVEGIKRIVAAGLPIRAGIIEMQENAGHMERAKRFLKELGVSEIRGDSQRGVGRGVQPLHTLQPMAELCGECWKGKLCVTSVGRAYPCVFSRFADLGTVKEGVHNVLGGDALAKFRHALKEYEVKRELKSKLSNEHKKVPMTATIHAMGACGPDVICSPDMECGPNCIPGSSKCMPVDFCVPDSSCAPDRSCNPTDRPRDPYPRCIPES